MPYHIPSLPDPSPPLIGAGQERCPYCTSTDIIKKGRRTKKFETVQLWYCQHCKKVFTPQLVKHKTYPIRVILEGLMLYYSGKNLTESAERLRERYGILVQPRTLQSWVAAYRPLTTYGRLRARGSKLFPPHQVIRSVRFHHRQVYRYQLHRGKLALILREDLQHRAFAPIRDYLETMAEACPHHLFRTGLRASDVHGKFDLGTVSIREKTNHATRTATLALQAVSRRIMRHETLQRFMLATDSVTVATEVPVYLTPEDLSHFRREDGFHIPIAMDAVLTGHIDFLQIRNGAVHILDYKPNATKEKPIEQLMFYALALSRRTGLRLFDFTCAWFDEHHYYEFFPLHIVHRKRRRQQ